jgi:uncharacterized protein
VSSIRIVESGDVVTFDVRVQPRASRSEIVGEYGAALKVRLAAPPVDGAANEELIKLLAKEMGVARRDVRILSGASSRTKTVEISGLRKSDVQHVADAASGVKR